MHEYETLYLLPSDLAQNKVEELNHRISEIVKNHSGHVLTLFNWGKRRLAYRVGKYDHGIFIYLNFLSKGDLISEIERILKYDDRVLKFITIKLEDKVDVEKRLQEKREPLLTSFDEITEKAPYEVAQEISLN